MTTKATESLAELYESDETAWLDAMAELIRDERLDELDYAHLKEFLEDNDHRDRWEIYCQLGDHLAGVLMWTYHREKLTASRRAEIMSKGFDLEGWLDSPTLRKHADTILRKTYTDAVARACAEAESLPTAYPAECPWTLDQLISVEAVVESERLEGQVAPTPRSLLKPCACW